jgi:hypothetical protein
VDHPLLADVGNTDLIEDPAAAPGRACRGVAPDRCRWGFRLAVDAHLGARLIEDAGSGEALPLLAFTLAQRAPAPSPMADRIAMNGTTTSRTCRIRTPAHLMTTNTRRHGHESRGYAGSCTRRQDRFPLPTRTGQGNRLLR